MSAMLLPKRYRRASNAVWSFAGWADPNRRNSQRTRRLLVRVVLFFLTVTAGIAQSPRCGPRELLAQLRFSDPVYTDALHLTRALDAAGPKVQCVLMSKMTSVFQHEKGAALFRTDQGDFEALFMASPYTFAGLQVSEAADRGYYRYKFSGAPRPRLATMEGRNRLFFVKQGETLFIVQNDEALADKLKALRLD